MPFIAIAIFLATVLVGGHVPPFDQITSPGYTLVATHGTYGIIIDERFAVRFLGEPGETWTPTREEIVSAEALLRQLRPDDAITPEQRQEAAVPEDLVSRTWYGGYQEGVRMLYVNGYCDGGMPDNPLMPVFVADGGPCFWYAIINAETWEIAWYIENGNA